MSRTVRLGGRLGGEVLLVEWSAVRRYRAGEAAEMLRDRCAAGSADADHLMALAASVGGFRGMPDTLEQAIELVAERIADGSITVVTLEPEYGGAAGRSQSSGVYGEPDWDDIRPLSDLRETDPTITFGALSIELVDHTGIPFRNQELKLRRGDGGIDRIVLDAQGKWNTRSIEKTGTCKLVLPARLELTTEQLADGGPDGFQITAGDLTVRREQPGELSLPRYDVHYRVVVDPPARPGTRTLPKEPAPGMDSLIVQIVDNRDQPLGRVAYELTTPDGRFMSGTLDQNGYLRCDNLASGECRLNLPDIDAREWRAEVVGARDYGPIPPFEGVTEPLPDDGDDEVDEDAPEYFEHRLRDVDDSDDPDDDDARPPAVRITFHGWDFDGRVFLPVSLSADPPTLPLDLVARVAAYSAARPEFEGVAIGHTDAVGASQFNSDLSAIRAKSLGLYLQGDREAWADLAAEQASVRDIQLVLCWLAGFCGVPCHPGPVDGDAGPWTAEALRAFRVWCGLPELMEGVDDCVTTAADWGEIFDAYDTWVATKSAADSPASPLGGGRVPIDAWLPCGEQRPAEDGQHRRVDLVLFDSVDAPTADMSAADVLDQYDIQELSPLPALEGLVYSGAVRTVALRALAFIRRKRFTLISNHIWTLHVRQLLRWSHKSWFRRGTNVRALVESTLSSADEVVDQGARLVFQKRASGIVGTKGEGIVRVVVEKASGRIVTAFPTFEFMKLAGGALGGALVISTAANIQARFAGYLAEQAEAEKAREGWFEFTVDLLVGCETVARDEDYVVFARIAEEEIARGRAVYEETIRRDNGMFRAMDDDEAAEFDESVRHELAAFNTWASDAGSGVEGGALA